MYNIPAKKHVAQLTTQGKLTKSVITYVWRLRGAKSKSLAGDPHMSSDCSTHHTLVKSHVHCLLTVGSLLLLCVGITIHAYQWQLWLTEYVLATPFEAADCSLEAFFSAADSLAGQYRTSDLHLHWRVLVTIV